MWTIQVLLGGAESKMVDSVMRRHIGTWDGSSGYTRIIGLVERDNMFWQSKECLKNQVEAWSRIEISGPFEDDLEMLCAGYEVSLERPEANSNWYRETKTLSVI